MLGYVLSYVMGVVSAAFFVVGFLAHKRHDECGTFFVRPKLPEPLVNTSREAMIERARAGDIDLGAYESETWGTDVAERT